MKTAEIIELSNDRLIEMAPAVGATEPMNGISTKYDFIPTLSAVEALRNAGWLPVEAKQSSVVDLDRAGYQRHMVRFTMPSLEIGDERIEMLVYNSHDCGSAFKMLLSIYRLICHNGLKHASPFVNFTHRHINFNYDRFVETSMRIANQTQQIVSQLDHLKAIELTNDQRNEYASRAHALIWEDMTAAPVQPRALLSERRYGDMGNDLWRTFNVVQENLVKGGIHYSRTDSIGRIANVKTRAIKSIKRDLDINQKLWQLTEDVAEAVA